MNRRMRKKWKVGEFREFGLMMKARVRDLDSSEFWDGLFDYVEARGIALGGNLSEGMLVMRACSRGRCLRCDRQIGRNRPRGPLTKDEAVALARHMVHALGADCVWAGPLFDMFAATGDLDEDALGDSNYDFMVATA